MNKGFGNNSDSIKRVTNIIVNNKQQIKSICLTSITESKKIDEIVGMFSEDIKTRGKTSELIDLKCKNYEIKKAEEELIRAEAENDYVIMSAPALDKNAISMYIAGRCDATIIIIEENAVNGNRAIHLKEELDMNGAKILGAIYLK